MFFTHYYVCFTTQLGYYVCFVKVVFESKYNIDRANRITKLYKTTDLV